MISLDYGTGDTEVVTCAAVQAASFSVASRLRGSTQHVWFVWFQEQSSFSWDWGPSFPTTGLWQGVRLEAYDALRLVHLSTVPVYST